ncbi:MAG: OmpA family protein [Ignavibacteria bacterium]|nr:OmpA family protein [Ignavibacteria bacterium]
MADKEINRFGLILFDIRSTDINENNKPIIGMIKKMIQPNSTVKIIGFTDQSGDPALNKVLAEKRAKTTARALGIPENSPMIEANGNSTTYDPSLPEGRLYTRTVDVIIETPINE